MQGAGRREQGEGSREQGAGSREKGEGRRYYLPIKLILNSFSTHSNSFKLK